MLAELTDAEFEALLARLVGYRIYEADIRIALAWAHLASGNPTAAKQEVTRAQTMSTDMGYHWGQVDAAEVLDHLP